MLPAVIAYSGKLARLAIGLDRRPELIAHLTRKTAYEGAGETLPERAANLLRQAFVTCLNDRSSGVKDGRAEGKKAGIYKIANLCLKILFQVGSLLHSLVCNNYLCITIADTPAPPSAAKPATQNKSS